MSQDKFWNDRERYRYIPPRYSEVARIPSVRELLAELSMLWKTNNGWLNYVDLGCGDCKGTRSFSEFLRRTTKMPVKVYGVDAAEACRTLCNEMNVQFLRVELGSEAISLREPCQVVTLFETIEHVFDTDFLLQSIREILGETGVLFTTTLNVVCWKNRILVPLGIQPFNTEVSTRKLSYGYKFDFLKRRVDTWKPAGHIRPFTLHSLEDLLEDNGFEVISTHGLENWPRFRFLEKVAKNMCTGILVVAKPKRKVQ